MSTLKDRYLPVCDRASQGGRNRTCGTPNSQGGDSQAVRQLSEAGTSFMTGRTFATCAIREWWTITSDST